METDIRVLVVEDSCSFRQLIFSSIQNVLPRCAIFEACDGVEAIKLAEQLRPELITLDIGLPKLSGLEAAKRIKVISPQSNILFITQESLADVIREAFAIGGIGYVVKSDAGKELVAAILAVLSGRRYVSRSAERQLGDQIRNRSFPRDD